MLSHDFVDMPGKVEGETAMMLRCRWCLKTPAKAREDGCAIHELEEVGKIVLSLYNPEGVEYFKDRTCVTCDQPIMGHSLHRGSDAYWCGPEVESEGINGCVYELNGVVAPIEPI